MRWAVNLYATEKTKKKLPRIMQKLRKRIPQPGIWLITLASNEQNLLDIFHSPYCLQPGFAGLDSEIVGVAESEEAAKELVVQIVQELYEATGGFDVRAFFEFRE